MSHNSAKRDATIERQQDYLANESIVSSNDPEDRFEWLNIVTALPPDATEEVLRTELEWIKQRQAYIAERLKTLPRQEPVSDNGAVILRQSNGDTVEVLEPLSQAETDKAVQLIEQMKRDEIQSEEDKAFLADMVQTLVPEEKKGGGSTKRKEKENLKLLQQELESSDGVKKLTAKDLSQLQYQLKHGNYKTRTIKQIRQGNTKIRASLFETF